MWRRVSRRYLRRRKISCWVRRHRRCWVSLRGCVRHRGVHRLLLLRRILNIIKSKRRHGRSTTSCWMLLWWLGVSLLFDHILLLNCKTKFKKFSPLIPVPWVCFLNHLLSYVDIAIERNAVTKQTLQCSCYKYINFVYWCYSLWYPKYGVCQFEKLCSWETRLIENQSVCVAAMNNSPCNILRSKIDLHP